MPIEIKEMHIKINVTDNAESPAAAELSRMETDRIIEACVEQVMEIISKKEER